MTKKYIRIDASYITKEDYDKIKKYYQQKAFLWYAGLIDGPNLIEKTLYHLLRDRLQNDFYMEKTLEDKN